jgi:hypothetical protein
MAGTTHQERGLPAHHGGGTLPLAERARQAKWFCRFLSEGGAGRSTPVHRPGLDQEWIGQGKVAWLSRFGAGHRQVKERFVGSLARLLSGQGIKRIRWRAKTGRCGGKA